MGDIRDFGRHTFSAEEIKRFALAYDPQPFHLDEEAAKDSLFGALCASGWHTASLMMQHLVGAFRREAERAAMAGRTVPRFGPSPGFDNLKWLKPVYAGDTISFSGNVVAKRLTRSRPGWGIVSTEATGTNQNGEMVFTVTTHVFVRMLDTG